VACSVAQSRKVSVADKSRTRFAVFAFPLICARHFEIEYAHTEALLVLVRPAITRTYHYACSRFLFAPQVNHRVRDRRIALNRISAGPKKKIARLQIIEFERILFLTHNRLEFARSSQPDVLLAGIAWYVIDPILFEHEINEARTVHSAICRIGRAVFVIEIAGGEFESRNEKLPYLRRIIRETVEGIRQQCGIRRAALGFFRTCRRRW
jgi:hypothetical protein